MPTCSMTSPHFMPSMVIQFLRDSLQHRDTLCFLLLFIYFYVDYFVNCADYHVVGCGDRTVSMWDHRNGNLLIDIEIELPTIGRNIACYTVGGDDVSIFLWMNEEKNGHSFRIHENLKRIIWKLRKNV